MALLASPLSLPLGGESFSLDEAVPISAGLLGVDIGLAAKGDTGRFGFMIGSDGDIVLDDTETHAVMCAVMEQAAGYWFDPTTGSKAFQITTLTTKTPSQVQAAAAIALEPVTAEGFIIAPAVSSARTADGQITTDITWTNADGAAQSATVTS